MKCIFNRIYILIHVMLLAACSFPDKEDDLLKEAIHQNMQRQTFLMNYSAYKWESYMRGTTGIITETFASNFVTQSARMCAGDISVRRTDLMLDSLKALFRSNHYNEKDSFYLREPFLYGDAICRQADMLTYTFDLSVALFDRYSSVYCGWSEPDSFRIVPLQHRGYYRLIPYKPAIVNGLQLEAFANFRVLNAQWGTVDQRVFFMKIPHFKDISHIYWTDRTRGYDRTFDFSKESVKRVYRSKK